jgi:ubiquinone/menaquinone biosynthesis C-methylase UbiE
MTNVPSPDGDSYFIDAESATEMARLTLQSRLYSEGMGGTFPEQPDLSNVHEILDIACGPGSWVLDAARAYPDREVVGVDISNIMIKYAIATAKAQKIDNAHFDVMNALNPLEFSDQAFGLVNARLIGGFMPSHTWPHFLSECYRILQPGGRVRLTECEGGMCGVTNSLACERLNHMGVLALQRAGHTFSPDGRSVGITPVLYHLLRDANYENIQHAAYALNWSAGAHLHEVMCENVTIGFRLLKPFLLKWQVTTDEEFEELYQQMQIDFFSASFCALMYFLTIWGTKPMSKDTVK